MARILNFLLTTLLIGAAIFSLVYYFGWLTGLPAAIAVVIFSLLTGGLPFQKFIPPVVKPPASEPVPIAPSYTEGHIQFFKDMKKFANTLVEEADFVPFNSYSPQYSQMNTAQQNWYFYWRNQVRVGKYIDTDLAYIFVYLYEIFNGIGWEKPDRGFELLVDIWGKYRKKHTSLDTYLIPWSFDFTHVFDLKYKLPFSDTFLWLPDLITDAILTKHMEAEHFKLPFVLALNLSDCSIDYVGLKHSKIAELIATADEYLLNTTQKRILQTFRPEKISEKKHILFKSGLIPGAGRQVVLKVREFTKEEALRKYIGDIIRYAKTSYYSQVILKQ